MLLFNLVQGLWKFGLLPYGQFFKTLGASASGIVFIEFFKDKNEEKHEQEFVFPLARSINNLPILEA